MGDSGAVRAGHAQPVALSCTVSDQTGGVLAHAEVILQDGAGKEEKTETDERGNFTLSVVAGQRYTLAVHEDGFGDYTRSVVGGQAHPPVQLAIANRAEQVSVDGGDSSVIDLQQTSAGAVLEEQQVANVPLNGRSFTDLLAIAPGVVPVSSAQPNAVVMSGVASTPPSGDLDIGALSVSGQRETANAFRVNGSNVQEDVNMGIAIVPTLDSVAELKVLTDSFDAKLGNQSGGQILVTTKSGGDQLHGSVYDYFRNTALDARSTFRLPARLFTRTSSEALSGGRPGRSG
jgi:hypothetical protein